MTEPLDLRPADLTLVRQVLDQFLPGREVWAFGSRVTGRAQRYSDLDLAVIGDQPLPVGLLYDLKEAFSESDLPFSVDVVDWATTSESFRRIIARDRVVVRKG